jgi:colanic acid biosynthesis glycosyl transferase WcaI
MRVALVTQFFPPETLAGANRVAAIAEALAPGVSLTIAAPEPSYPDATAYRSYEPPSLPAGVELRRISPFGSPRRSWFARAAAEAWMAMRLAGIAARSRPDVVVASSPSMFLGPPSLAAARARSATFIWDLRDLTWEYGKEGDVIAGRLARRSLRALARIMWSTARASDVVVCATDGLAVAVREHLPRQRIEVVRNGIDSSLFATFDPAPRASSERTRVLYAGLIGHAQELETLVEVATRAPDLELVLAGDGPRRAALEALASQRGLDNISFTGYISPAELVRLYHGSDVLFAQLRRSRLHAITAAPSKLLEYMAAARPIVYAGEGAAASMIDTIGAGVAIQPDDAGAAIDAIRRLASSEGMEMGARGRAYVDGLPSRAEEMSRFASLIGEFGRKP